MTSDFVPFEGKLEFTAPNNLERALLVLEKDNPSGLPEYAEEITIPLRLR